MIVRAIRQRGAWLIAALVVLIVPIVDPQNSGFAQSPAELITAAIAIGALGFGILAWLSHHWDLPATFTLDFMEGQFPVADSAKGQHAKVMAIGDSTFLLRVRVKDPVLMREINLRFLNHDLTDAPTDAIEVTGLVENKVARQYLLPPIRDDHGGMTLYLPDEGLPKGGGEDVFLTVTCAARQSWSGKISFRRHFLRVIESCG